MHGPKKQKTCQAFKSIFIFYRIDDVTADQVILGERKRKKDKFERTVVAQQVGWVKSVHLYR